MTYDAPPLVPLLGGVGLLEHAVEYLVGNLEVVTPASLSNPTPCSEWDMAALLRHLNDSLTALTEAADVGLVGVHPIIDESTGNDRVALVRDRAQAAVHAWSRTGRSLVAVNGWQLTSTIVVSTGALEVAVHGWDIARACGRHQPIPAHLAEDLLVLSMVLVTDRDRPVRFAPPVFVPRAASPSDRLVAFLGRRPAPSIPAGEM
jgi:uncharacterized protein (TIGR03086 family)